MSLHSSRRYFLKDRTAGVRRREVEGASKGSGLNNEVRAAEVEAVRTAGGSEVRSSLWDVLGWRHPWTPR